MIKLLIAVITGFSRLASNLVLAEENTVLTFIRDGSRGSVGFLTEQQI